MAAAAPNARLDRLFHALADPARRRLVERLARGPASATELAGAVPLALPSLVKHLRILEDGGIVVSRKHGRVRTYGMRPEGLAPLDDWVTRRRTAMAQALDRLGALLATLPGDGT